MNLDKHTTLLAAIAGTFSFIFLNIIFHLPIKTFWSITISLLLFALIKFLAGTSQKQFDVKLPTFYFLDVVLITAYFISATFIFFNVFSSSLPQYVDWFNLSISSYLQFGASVVLTSFLPGYMILRISGNTERMSALAVCVFSLTLSMFLTASFFLIFVIFLSVNIALFAIILLLTNLSLIICQISRILVDRLKKDVRVQFFRLCKYAENNLYEVIVIVLAILLIYSFAFSLLYYNSPLPYYDEWQHYGTAVRLLTSARDGSFTKFFSAPSISDFWPCSYIASTNLLSAFPPLNGYYLLHFLVILPLLCVYLLFKGLFSKVSPKLPVVATTFTMFGGFGGLYALLTIRNGVSNSINLSDLFKGLLAAGDKTYDINGLVVFHLAPYISPAQIWGLTSFLLLLFLIQPNINLGRSRWFLIALVVAYGYLGHYSPEIFMFLLLFLILAVFLRSYTASFVRKTGISTFFGLLVVLASDFLIPVSLYSKDISYLLCVVISCLIILSPQVKKGFVFLNIFVHKSMTSKKIADLRKSRFLVPVCFFSILYTYALSLLIWINVLPSFEIYKTAWGSGADFVPWYLYPIRLGVVGLVFLFALLGMVIYRTYRRNIARSFMLCFVLLVLSFVVGKSFHLFPIYMESRLTTFILLALSPVAAYTIVYFSSHADKLRKKTLLAVLVTVIGIVGFLSPLYYVEYLSIYNTAYVWFPYNVQVSNQEFQGLQYLYQHANSNTTVLTVTFESRFAIASFGGIPMERAFGGSSSDRDYSRVFLQPKTLRLY